MNITKNCCYFENMPSLIYLELSENAYRASSLPSCLRRIFYLAAALVRLSESLAKSIPLHPSEPVEGGSTSFHS